MHVKNNPSLGDSAVNNREAARFVSASPSAVQVLSKCCPSKEVRWLEILAGDVLKEERASQRPGQLSLRAIVARFKSLQTRAQAEGKNRCLARAASQCAVVSPCVRMLLRAHVALGFVC